MSGDKRSAGIPGRLCGSVAAISLSPKKGTKKRNIDHAELREDHGIVGDAHAGDGNRQISLLAEESIEKMRGKGLEVKAGDFAENITTKGIDLLKLGPGSKIKVGPNVVLEITQLGKRCHSRCEIYLTVGDCVMPKEGIFARVLKGGVVKPADILEEIS